MACRSKEKADNAIREIKAETGKEALFLGVDLSDFKSVKAACRDFLA